MTSAGWPYTSPRASAGSRPPARCSSGAGVLGTVVGGPFVFTDRGFHDLKGVPGRWPLLALGD